MNCTQKKNTHNKNKNKLTFTQITPISQNETNLLPPLSYRTTSNKNYTFTSFKVKAKQIQKQIIHMQRNIHKGKKTLAVQDEHMQNNKAI